MKTSYQTIIFILLLPFLSYANEKNQLMPSELIEYGESVGCYAIDKFYNIDGNIDGPFTYGIASEKKSKSAAFWCKKDRTKKRKYYIQIFLKDEDNSFSCKKNFRVSMSSPLGLSVLEKDWDLTKFDKETTSQAQSSREDFKTYSSNKNSKKIHAKALIIENTYRLTLAYICHEGAWYDTILKH